MQPQEAIGGGEDGDGAAAHDECAGPIDGAVVDDLAPHLLAVLIDELEHVDGSHRYPFLGYLGRSLDLVRNYSSIILETLQPLPHTQPIRSRGRTGYRH